jgi:hypothetical protein
LPAASVHIMPRGGCFGGGFEQATILRTGPDGLTRVIVRRLVLWPIAADHRGLRRSTSPVTWHVGADTIAGAIAEIGESACSKIDSLGDRLAAHDVLMGPNPCSVLRSTRTPREALGNRAQTLICLGHLRLK